MDIESGGTIMQRLKWKRKCMGEGREIIWGGKKSKVATNIIRIVWTFFISNGHRYLYWHAYIIYVLATLHYVFAMWCVGHTAQCFGKNAWHVGHTTWHVSHYMWRVGPNRQSCELQGAWSSNSFQIIEQIFALTLKRIIS